MVLLEFCRHSWIFVVYPWQSSTPLIPYSSEFWFVTFFLKTNRITDVKLQTIIARNLGSGIEVNQSGMFIWKFLRQGLSTEFWVT